jgi:MFS family permease
MVGVAFGTLLGSAVFIPITAMGSDVLLTWGWRIPFLLAGPLMLFTLWIRSKVTEPEVFKEVRAEEATDESAGAATEVPVFDVVKNQWPNLLRVIFCSLFALAGSMGSVFAVSYATQYAGLAASTFLTVSTIVGFLILPIAPLWAIASDKIGRRPIFIFSVLGMAVLFPLLFAAFQSGSWLLIALVFVGLQVVASAGNIVQAPFYTEMFPTRVRFTGYALGTQVGLVVVGFSPAIAAAIVRPGVAGWIPVAIFIAVCMVIAAISAWSAKETKGMEIHEVDALVKV